ncbi:MarR family winged helix-turn-helix transcriptional regulator [Kitasatospora sp. NPDC004240]
MQQSKPIGYWLNRTDRALTLRMDAVLAGHGLTRLAWQVLNVVRDDPAATDAAVLAVLVANAEAPALTAAVGRLLDDAWLTRPAPDRLALTADGRARLARAAERITAFRAASMTGISPEEYRTAVSVLERMTANVETADVETSDAETEPTG